MINNLSGYLNNLIDEITITPIISPFNQVSQILLNPNLECWNSNPDFSFVFCQPEKIFSSFNKLLNNEPVTVEEILTEVDEFIEQLLICSSRVKFTILATFTVDENRYFGASSFDTKSGITYILSKINITISQKLTHANGFYIVNSQRWITKAGINAYQPKLWYLSKNPFHNTVYEYASKDIYALVKTIYGYSKKLIILDLDDTIWGGILGDVGWENLIIGGHNALGEAYQDFQKIILSIANKGVQLAIVSKNEETIALTAIENHKEMVLRKTDFVAWKINWKDKAQNILELTTELKIGLNSVVFIDDNPVERARVKESLPSVFVPEMPNDKLLFPSYLQSLNCFPSLPLSNEDLNRNIYYKNEKIRNQSLNQFQSMEDWLATTNIKITAEKVNDSNFNRVVQLLNKTNQMNLATRRMTENELLILLEQKSNLFYAFSLSDRFGDSGLIGILALQFKNEIAYITDFVLSCRVMGRKCEETMLSFSIQLATVNNCQMLYAEYLPTEKNKPCLSFFTNSTLQQNKYVFSWDCKNSFQIPSYINFNFE